MNSIEIAHLYPIFTCVSYYVIVFILAEFARKLADSLVSKNSLAYTFLIELIATAQMCTCVYENGIMIEYYGLVGFFFTVICALIAGSIYNREAFVSPLPPIENFWYGSYRVDKLITIIIAEAIGGYAAFRIARALWYYSSGFFQEHYALYDNLSCELIYHVPFWAAVLFEIFGCFLLRLAVPRIPQDYQFYLEPVFVSGVITFALGFIGVAGLNPVVTSSALQGCEGLGLEWFIFIYWVCPVIGWMLAAHLEHKSTPKIGEGVKKRQ